MKRLLGVVAGCLFAEVLMHLKDAGATSLEATTMGGRIGAVVFGIVVLGIFMMLIRRFFAAAFFNGFTVATGLFLSFDIVVFHWIFHLHRLTNGPEADWLEPIFVVAGLFLVYFGIRNEKSKSNKNKHNKVDGGKFVVLE